MLRATTRYRPVPVRTMYNCYDGGETSIIGSSTQPTCYDFMYGCRPVLYDDTPFLHLDGFPDIRLNFETVRLRALQAQERQCSTARIQEANIVQKMTTCGARTTPVTTTVGSARREIPRSSKAQAQFFLGSENTDAGDGNRALKTGGADITGTDGHARSPSKISNSQNHHAIYDRDCDDSLRASLARHEEEFLFEEDVRERHPRCCNPRRDDRPRMPDEIQGGAWGEEGSGDWKDLRVVMW